MENRNSQNHNTHQYTIYKWAIFPAVYIYFQVTSPGFLVGVSSMVGLSSKGRSVFTGALMIGDYPLVNIQKTIENHHF